MKKYTNTMILVGMESEKDRYFDSGGTLYFAEDSGALYLNTGRKIVKLAMNSTVVGEPEGSGMYYNAVHISQEDYDQAVIDNTWNENTLYTIIPEPETEE